MAVTAKTVAVVLTINDLSIKILSTADVIRYVISRNKKLTYNVLKSIVKSICVCYNDIDGFF